MPLGKEVSLSPRQIVLDGDPVGTQPPTSAPPHFRPLLTLAKRSPISATAEKSQRNKGTSLPHLEWRMLMQIVHTVNEQV